MPIGAGMSIASSRRPLSLLAPIGFGLLYLASVMVGRHFIDPAVGLATIWPAAGVAVGVLAVSKERRSMMVALVVTNAAGNLLTAATPTEAFAFASANAAAALTGAIILAGGAGGVLESVRRIWRLLAASLAAGVVGGVLGSAFLAVLGSGADFGRMLVTWSVADAVGVLLFAPLVAVVKHAAPFPGWARVGRNVAVTAGAAAVVLGITHLAVSNERPIMYLAVPSFMLAAMIVGGRNLVVAMAALSLALAEMTHAGAGPFAAGEPATDVLSLQAFIAVLSVSAMSVASIHRRSAILAQQTAQTLEAVQSAVLVVDAGGSVTFVNRAAAEAFGSGARMAPLTDVFGLEVAGLVLHGEDGSCEVTIATPRGPVAFDITTGRFSAEDGPSTVLVARDLTERKAAESRIRNLSAVVEMSPDFIGFADTEGTIQYLSPGARQMLGLGDEPVEGMKVGSFAPDWAASLIRDVAIPRAIAEGRWRGESAYLSPDGSETPVMQVVMAHRGEDGELEMLSTVAHDMTDRIRMERERSELVANLAHDLRNPLGAISGAAEILADDVVAGRTPVMALVEIVEAGASQLRRLVDDLIVGDELPGATHQPPEIVNLLGLASRVVSLHLLPAANNAVSLAVEGVPAHVTGDRGALHRMVENLVTNAIKYSPQGGSVLVAVQQDGDEAVLSVHDQGIGIDAADLPGMFQRYHRASTAKSAGIGGTGLGLAICRQVAEQHGGTISVESTSGAGSTFAVRLPTGVAATVSEGVLSR